MSALSRRQKIQRQSLDEQLRLGLPPQPSALSLPGRYSGAERTKQTVDNHSSDRIREGSPPQAATASESSRTHSERGNLLSNARSIFGNRPALYSVDVYGRRSEIDTRNMGPMAYRALLDAFEQADLPYEPISPLHREAPPGGKIGPETGLPLPDWWELPDEATTSEELQALLRRNLNRAAKDGKSPLVRAFPRAGAKDCR